jgi:uncharacterized protein YjhX (UPF0386 family)
MSLKANDPFGVLAKGGEIKFIYDAYRSITTTACNDGFYLWVI